MSSIPVIPEIDRATMLRLAGEASVDPRTVARFYQGKPVLGLGLSRMIAAAKRLKIKLPKGVQS